MNADNEVIASRSLVAVTRQGDRLNVELKIGKPYRASDVDWACPVALDGLHNALADMHGVDSLQALVLAIRLTRGFLQHFIESGGSIYWPGEEAANQGLHLDEIFGSAN